MALVLTSMSRMSRPPRRVTLDALHRDAGGVAGRVRVEGIDDRVEVRRLGDDIYRVSIEGHRFEVVVARGIDSDWGCVDGRTYRWPRGPRDGRVTAVRCEEGDQVDPGVPLVELG